MTKTSVWNWFVNSGTIVWAGVQVAIGIIWSVLVVTDHGFIHWPGSDERSVSPPVAGPAYSSRRALAYPEQVKLSGPQGLAPGGKWRIAVPSGAANFRAYGGLGYFHGGASLQEWIIPCIKIEWPQRPALST